MNPYTETVDPPANIFPKPVPKSQLGHGLLPMKAIQKVGPAKAQPRRVAGFLE